MRHYPIVRQVSSRSFFNARGDNNVAYDSRAFLHKCDIVKNLIAIPVEALTAVCIYINIDDQIYIGLPVKQKKRE